MASSRVRSRASGLTIGVEADGFDRTAREFKEVRRRITKDLVEVERQAAEHTVLPEAKHNASRYKVAGDSLGSHLVVRKARSGPQLTTNFRGIRARAAGLLEFGGTVRTEIRPVRKRALLVNGQPIAIVRTARVYRARHYLTDAAHGRLDEFGEHVRDAIVDFFGPPFDRT
jgi:hypothetical protein